MHQNLHGQEQRDQDIWSARWGASTKTLDGNYVIPNGATIKLFFDLGGSDRTVTLPEARRGLSHQIYNLDDTGVLTVQDAGANTIALVYPGGHSVDFLVSDTEEWSSFGHVFGPSGADRAVGLVPIPPLLAGTTRFLREDGTWQVPPGGGGAGDAFGHVTDGTNTADSSGDDTFKLRSANAILTVAVTNDDITHGDNALFTIDQTQIDHDALLNFVVDEHIAHGSVSINTAANSGLAGGGTIAASRSLTLDINNLTADTPVLADSFAFLDAGGGDTNKATLTTLNSILDHDALVNFAANEHIDHTLVSISAGPGLTGGGTIAASRTISLDITGQNAVAAASSDEMIYWDVSESDFDKMTFSTLNGILDHNSLLNYAAARHALHPGVSTDNAIARYDGVTGDLQNSGVTISDTDVLTVPTLGLQVGSSVPFADAAGTLTLQNVDALDATTETTIEAAIDTLANLTSVQGRTVTLADAGFDVLFGWDDSGSAYKNFALADIATEAAPAAGDFVLIYGAEGDLRKVDWSGLPAGSGSPGGANTQVQFNDGGAFGGDSAFTWDKTNDILAVNGQGIFGHSASVAINSGGADPVGQVHAPFGDSSAAVAAFYYWAADANGPQFNFAKSRHATKGSHTVVQDADDLGVLMFRGSDGTNFIQGAWIIAEVSGTPGTNDMPTRLLFGTTADGASSPTNRMIISADGAVTPAANDGTALGSTSLQWSDLHLAEGGVINFDNGDLTLTQSGNNLTVAGGTLTVNGLREAEVVLTDAANVTLDSTLGNTFKLTAAGNRQIDAPTNKPASGFVQKIVIAHEASGADRTLTLQTGVAGGFRFGTSITALTATTNGLVDYIGCIYNDADDRWDVVSYVKGF